MELSLSGQHWQLKGFWPFVPLKETSMETGQTLQGVTDWIDAGVPGGVHYDLWKAGLIENPYLGTNSLHCEWVENRWWMYRTTFSRSLAGVNLSGRRVRLVCKGLDYEAQIFLNDVCLGTHQGMYDPFCADVTPFLQEENELVVLFMGVPQEMGQIGYTSRTSTQKSRFNYKWDFSTRLVNIGIWQDVVLEVEDALALEDLHLDTDYQDGMGRLLLEGRLSGAEKEAALSGRNLVLRLTVSGPFDRRGQDVKRLVDMAVDAACAKSGSCILEEGAGSRKDGGCIPAEDAACPQSAQDGVQSVYTVCLPVSGEMISETLEMEHPMPWAPNGSGTPFLYQVRAELLWQGSSVWEKTLATGFRRLRLVQNEQAPENALPYTFQINGEKTWIRGGI